MTIITMIITKYGENDNGARAAATDDSKSITLSGRKLNRR
jgi:hypothetical protein